MRNLQPLREDLKKHFSVGFLIALFFSLILFILPIQLTSISIAIMAQSLVIAVGYGEEIRQAFTVDRTPANDDALITSAGGLLGSHFFILISIIVRYVQS